MSYDSNRRGTTEVPEALNGCFFTLAYGGAAGDKKVSEAIKGKKLVLAMQKGGSVYIDDQNGTDLPDKFIPKSMDLLSSSGANKYLPNYMMDTEDEI